MKRITVNNGGVKKLAVSLAFLAKLVLVSCFLAGGNAVWASDQTLTWSSSKTPSSLGADGELTFTYTDGKVQTLTATLAAGDTITLSGDTVAFAADAVVTLSGSGNFIVENTLTGENGLIVTNAQNAALVDFLDPTLLNHGASAAFKTVFPGCDLDDISLLYANQHRFDGRTHDGIAYAAVGNPQISYPYMVRRMTEGGVKKLTCQMQACYISGGKWITKTALLELKQSGADIVGRTIASYYPWAKLEGEDILNLYQLWRSNPDATVNTEVLISGGYRIGHLRATWSGAPGVSLKGDLSGLGGALTVAKGAKADILGATAAPPSVFISGQFVVGDANLTLGGTVGGDSNGALVLEATQAGSYTVTLSDTHLNRMVAAFGQDHRTDGAYGEKYIDIRGRLVIKGDSAAGKTMICKANSWSAFPTNGIVEVRDGGVLDLTGLASRGSPNGGGTRQNDSATIRVYKGGLVKHNKNWTTLNEQRIELCGGTFESQRTSGVTFSYQNNMLFEDGGALTSKGGTFWAGNTAVAPLWKVRGSSPSTCEAPLNVLGTGGGFLRVLTLDVADVTGNDQPDFIFKKNISIYSDFEAAGINKTGIGTALLMGVFGLRNGFQVSCGTLMLGISNGWTGGALTMHGGTFAVSNNTVNAVAQLKVGERGGTIKIGDGATLSFADSSALESDWKADLVIEGFREGALRFGGSADALTESQVTRLRLPSGRHLHLLSNGFVSAVYGTRLVVQ